MVVTQSDSRASPVASSASPVSASFSYNCAVSNARYPTSAAVETAAIRSSPVSGKVPKQRW